MQDYSQERISKARARELLASGEWHEDPELTSVLGFDSYQNDRGQALIILAGRTGANLCDNRDALLAYYQEAGEEPPTHLLEGRFPYDASFPEEVPRLVNVLAVVLGVERSALDMTERSLDLVEDTVRRIGYEKFLSEDLFPALVAYVGEVIRNATEGRWHMERAGDVWEPWIRGRDGRTHPPFAIVFRELNAGERGSIRGAVNGQIRAHRLG